MSLQTRGKLLHKLSRNILWEDDMSTSRWIESARAADVDNRARILALTVRAGTGTECAYCHKPIEPGAVEHEVEALVLARRRVLHFHRLCQHLWETR
jgi:hypothetical protein